MKRRLILALLLVVSVFAIAGCGSKKYENVVKIGNKEYKLNEKSQYKDLIFKENKKDFHTSSIGGYHTMSIPKGTHFVFQVAVDSENKKLDELVKSIKAQKGKKTEKGTKTVNGIKYTYFEYKNSLGDKVHKYVHYYNNRTYIITFVLAEDSGNVEEVFMNNVEFKTTKNT